MNNRFRIVGKLLQEQDEISNDQEKQWIKKEKEKEAKVAKVGAAVGAGITIPFAIHNEQRLIHAAVNIALNAGFFAGIFWLVKRLFRKKYPKDVIDAAVQEMRKQYMTEKKNKKETSKKA